jgi:hypothetical protein
MSSSEFFTIDLTRDHGTDSDTGTLPDRGTCEISLDFTVNTRKLGVLDINVFALGTGGSRFGHDHAITQN